MSIARLVVEQVGPAATIQDAGRPGHMRFGVPVSGPVDRIAFAAVNAALGNAPGAAMVETGPGPLVLHCIEGELACAIGGPGFGVKVDDALSQPWSVVLLRPGMRLSVRDSGAGHWGYLGLAGALAANIWLGSAATHRLANLGGGALQKGQILEISAARVRESGPIAPPDIYGDGPVRVVLGPQHRYFDKDAIAALETARFTVSHAFDRMGMRLDGPALMPHALDMPSEPALRGALQLDGSGGMAMLLADHQTTGGYPKIAMVVGSDSDALAQRPTGTVVAFRVVTPERAVALARAASAQTHSYIEALQSAPSQSERLMQANLIDGVVDARK